MIIPLPNLAATEALASRLAPLLRPGDAILLDGELGAGKTAFARALLRAIAGNAALDVPSPSYTLVQTYETPLLTLHHFDLWRLAGPDALAELGWDDARHDVVIVEWPDRLADFTPPQALVIEFSISGGASREVVLSGWSADRLARISHEQSDGR